MSLFESLNLGTGFRKHFSIAAAMDTGRKDEVFRIRHQVYCEELGFEPVRENGLETDDYDGQSLHCLLSTSDERRLAVGCNRLVRVAPDEPDALLPFEKTCAKTLDRRIIDSSKLPRNSIAEVSRLAVISTYRRRRGEESTHVSVRDEDFGTPKQPRFPYIPVGLYLGAVALAERHGIETMFVLTEPRLANHFAKLGVTIRQIGGPVEHRGTRIPSMMDVQSIIKGMRFMVKPMWKVIREEIDATIPSPS